MVTPRSTRGHGLVFADRPADGLAETDAALRLARDLDAPEGQAYALWHRSEALSALGRTDEAEADAREALRDRPGRGASRLDRDRAPGAGDRPADRRRAGRGRGGVRGLGGGRRRRR